MQAIVDRIEGEYAVLEINGTDYMDVPLKEMPDGCAAGDVYSGSPGNWKLDRETQKARLDLNAELMRKVFKR